LSNDRTAGLGPRGDDFYGALMEVHEGLSFEESARLNARLVLILADAVGNIDALRRAITLAKKERK